MPDELPFGGGLNHDLNDGQRKAEREIEATIGRRGKHLLTGNAGSGKTYLLQKIAARYPHRMVLTAPTHQAVRVLQAKMEAAGVNIPCLTTYAFLGLVPKIDGDKLRFVRDRKAVPPMAEIVGVDETSMVGEDLAKHIERGLRGKAVLYSGDPAQLFPVGEGESPTFQTKRRSHLTEPVRQARDNPILAAALRIRDAQDHGADWSWARSANRAPYGVFVPSDPEAWLKRAFMSDQFDTDENAFRYLTWSNKVVEHVNAQVRLWRYGVTDMPFVRGERAIMRAPVVRGRTVLLNNGEYVIVKDIARGEHQRVGTWRMTVESKVQGDIEVHAPRDRVKYNATLDEIAQAAHYNPSLWKKFHAFKAGFAEVQAVYAGTVHTAQGATIRNVFLNMPELRRWVAVNADEGLRGLYVAATRPSHGLILV